MISGLSVFGSSYLENKTGILVCTESESETDRETDTYTDRHAKTNRYIGDWCDNESELSERK